MRLMIHLQQQRALDGEDFIIGGTQVLTLVGTASSASAVTTVINGGIQFIDITNRGRNYTFAPRVAISSAPTGGVTGIATANLPWWYSCL